MKLSQGFAPHASTDATKLILGSMPGVASLEAGQYYAYGRNAFWKIIGDLYGAGPELDYQSRLKILSDRRIALWDVIKNCHRPGSLDSSIAEAGLITNDFTHFFSQHSQITRVYFNGLKAASLFNKKVLPLIDKEIEYHLLPSTSPANAATDYAAKLQAWSVLTTD